MIFIALDKLDRTINEHGEDPIVELDDALNQLRVLFQSGNQVTRETIFVLGLPQPVGMPIEDVSGLVQDGTESSIRLIVQRQRIYRRTEPHQIWLEDAHKQTLSGSVTGDRIGTELWDDCCLGMAIRGPTFEVRGGRSEAEGTKMRSILAVPLDRWVGHLVEKHRLFLDSSAKCKQTSE